MSPRSIAAATVVAIAGLVFGRACGFDFLMWDDPTHVTANRLLRDPSWAALGPIWRASYEGLYIPVSYSVWLGAAAISRNPALFHGLNVALHAVNGALVLALCGRLLEDRALGPRARALAALAGALVFVLHPLQVEAVAWVSALRDLLSATLVLLVLHLLLFEPRRIALALGVFLLALLAKPSAVCAPLIVLAVRGRSGLKPALTLSVAVLPALLWTRAAQHALDTDTTALWMRPLVALDAVYFYLLKLVWPADLAIDHLRHTPGLAASGALYWTWLLPAALLLLAWVSRRRAPALGVALAVFVAGLLPTLGLVGYAFQSFSNVADRYAYLAMLGPAYLAARAVAAGGQRAAVAVLGVATAWAVVTSVILGAWQDDEALFSRALRVQPESAIAATQLGLIRSARGDLEGARADFARAVGSRPTHMPALVNLGSTLTALGRNAEAVPHLQRAVDLSPPSAQLELNLGAAMVLSGDIDGGVLHYRRALELNPQFAEAYNNLGAVDLAYGRNAAAAALFERAVELSPHDPGFRKNLERARAAP